MSYDASITYFEATTDLHLIIMFDASQYCKIILFHEMNLILVVIN